MVVHLVSPDERYDMLYLSNYALLQVKDELARLPGVGAVQVFGAGEYSMRVWLDPEQAGVARSSRRPTSCGAIREQNVQVAAGVLGAPPAPSGATFQLTDQRAGAADRRKRSSATSSCAPTPEGQITRLADVARVELGSSRYSLRSLLDNKPAVGDRRLPAPRHQRAPGLDRRARDDGAAEEELPAGRRLPDRLRPDGLRARVDQRGGRTRCSRRSCSSSSWWSSSCRPGAPRSSRWSPCRCR